MPSLRDQFPHFYMPDEDAVKAAMQTGLITPDTNVLLNLYRLQSGARDQLFGAMEKAGDRLWVSHQVGLEFLRNRLNVMHEQQEFFSKTEDAFDKLVEGLREKVREFRARIALSEDQIAGVEESIQQLQERFTRLALGAADANVCVGEHASDKVLARIEALFENRVSAAMTAAEFEEARKEAQRRVREKIPPGYMDRDKPDPSGDYLVWRQIMTEAKARKVPAILVTDDRKEDWYRREHGLTLGARPELRQEMATEAGVAFIAMRTGTFLHHAETYLDAEVSDETIAQVKELPARPPSVIFQLSLPREFSQLEPRLTDDWRERLLEGIRSGKVSHNQLMLASAVLHQMAGIDQAVTDVGAAVIQAHTSGAITAAQADDAFQALADYAVRHREDGTREP
jgi:hypothetical protein